MKYVIIGNSAAGVGAVEGIRRIDRHGEIVVISDEPHHTYSRPLISYLLLGKTTEEKMKYRGDNFYTDNNVEFINAKAAQIDTEGKRVILSDGEGISYDKLLVAAGSSAFVPPFEGIDEVESKFTFMSLDDAKALEKTLDKEKRVLIVGAGLIGLKCAEGILKRVKSITVVDLAPRILSSILDEDGAKIVQKHMESMGVKFKLAQGVKRFLKGGEDDRLEENGDRPVYNYGAPLASPLNLIPAKNTAVLDDGGRVDFDILVLAVGVRPNTSLLNGIADIERGIVISEKSETSAKDIYAAGDCTQTIDSSSGVSKIMALLPNAYTQGETAGMNMAGGDISFDNAIPMNAIGFFGLHIITAGNYTGEAYSRNESGQYKRLFYGDNKLNGYILIGNVEKAGIYTSLIREQTPLDRIDFSLVREKPGLMAFRKEDRIVKLGGVAQ